MAFVEVGNDQQGSGSKSPIQKWNSTGQTVEGVYRGQRPGKYGPLVVIQTPNGEVVYGSKAVLARKLESVKPGDRIRIEYLGKRKSQAGTEYGDFRVLVDSAPESIQSPKDGRPLYDLAEFNRLCGLLKADKGDSIANALATAARATGDPVTSLRAAMEQVGTPTF